MVTGLKGNEVRIEEYSEEWPKRFEAERAELQEILKPLGAKLRIEHVGSTSVKGMVAKPIIDIAIGLPTRELVGDALALMLAAGRTYVKWGNQPGMLLMASGDPRQVFYHLVVRNSPAWSRLVTVREQLRRNPKIAATYMAIKKQLAEEHPSSRLMYAAGKKAILSAIIGRGFDEVLRHRVTRARWRAEAELETDLARHYGIAPGAAPPVKDPDITEAIHAPSEGLI